MAEEVVPVPRIKLGSQGLEVSAQGLGCMGMSAVYGPAKPEDDMLELLRHAVAAGVTFLDTSDAYGPFTNELLLGKALRDGGGLASGTAGVQVATKFGVKFTLEPDRGWEFCGSPAYVRQACEASLRRLGVSCIDLYYQHRVDNRVPIEITMGELKKLVEEVKIKELGIGIVAYSPLGRGFFGSGAKSADNLSEGDIRKKLPRFQNENLEHNQQIFEKVNEMATRKGCTPSQLALAWVHHRGADVCPIPGTTKMANLKSNVAALALKLTPEEMAELESYAAADAVRGFRTHSVANTWMCSDTPQLESFSGESD